MITLRRYPEFVILALVLFIIFFPLLLSAQPEAGGGELKGILPFVSQGGLGVILFIIWYFTFNKANKNNETAFRKYDELALQLIQLLKEEQEHKSLLAGILSRLEVKLDTSKGRGE